MANITINNSTSNVQCSIQELSLLRKSIYYDAPKNYAIPGNKVFNTKRSLVDRKGNFTTGLLPRVLKVLSKEGIRFDIQDVRHQPTLNPTPLKLRVTPYDAQTAAVDAALKAHRGTISMPTGTGKSLVIAMLISRIGLKSLVVVPTVEIKKQLTESLTEAFGSLKNITIENIDSNTLKKGTNYDCLIVDECHHSAAKTYRKLNRTAWNGIYYRFFLTATPFRNQTEEQILFESIAGQVIFKLSYKTAIDKGYIVPVEAYYYDLPKQHTDAYTYAQVYSELVVNNDHRNQLIADLLKNLHSGGISALCLVKEIKHGNNLHDMTYLPFVNGQDEDTRGFIKQFNDEKAKVLIGTTGVLGEGVDTKPCEYVIIAGLGKAKSHFQQQIGRGVRRYKDKQSCKIILFRDSSHKFTLRHFNEQKKILLEEYGVVPVKLKV